MKEYLELDESFDSFEGDDDWDDHEIIDSALFETDQKVLYKTSFGTGKRIEATIIGIDTKNGEVVYDLDNGTWCYETQVIGLA